MPSLLNCEQENRWQGRRGSVLLNGCVQPTPQLPQKFPFWYQLPAWVLTLSQNRRWDLRNPFLHIFFQSMMFFLPNCFFLSCFSLLFPVLPFSFPFYFGPQINPFPSMSTAVGSNLINSSLIAYPTHTHTHPPSIPLAIQQPSLKKGKYFHTN